MWYIHYLEIFLPQDVFGELGQKCCTHVHMERCEPIVLRLQSELFYSASFCNLDNDAHIAISL